MRDFERSLARMGCKGGDALIGHRTARILLNYFSMAAIKKQEHPVRQPNAGNPRTVTAPSVALSAADMA